MNKIVGYLLTFPVYYLLVCQFEKLGLPWYAQVGMTTLVMVIHDVGLAIKTTNRFFHRGPRTFN